MGIPGTARCGRCGDLLPDETLTYCRSCGTPFSRVPATTSFVLLTERAEILRERKRRWQIAGASFLLCLGFAGLAMFAHLLMREVRVQRLQSMRDIAFYTYDIEGFPQLPRALKRSAIAAAVQAFEDHFDLPLRNYRVLEDQIPPSLDNHFTRSLNPLKLASNQNSIALLSHWEESIFPEQAKRWRAHPNEELPVLITNIPIFADNRGSSSVETLHLSRQGLLSGLGHPSLVVVSTYRMLNEQAEYANDKLPAPSNEDKIKLLGEYTVAHELGHALLGLNDFVVDLSGGNHVRGPASISRLPAPLKRAVSNTPLGQGCLMHTDAGGGFLAWDTLRARQAGTRSPCGAYQGVTQAMTKRMEAVNLLKRGEWKAARALHQEAIETLELNARQNWLLELWRSEHGLFDPWWKL